MNNQTAVNDYNKKELDKKYHKHVLINYCIISCVVIALSFIGLIFFNEWALPVCTAECAIFGLAVMFLLNKSHGEITNESGKGSFAIYLILRYACMIIGIVIACLIVKYTMGSEVNKMRYVIVLIGAIPYFVPTISLLITKQEY